LMMNLFDQVVHHSRISADGYSNRTARQYATDAMASGVWASMQSVRLAFRRMLEAGWIVQDEWNPKNGRLVPAYRPNANFTTPRLIQNPFGPTEEPKPKPLPATATKQALKASQVKQPVTFRSEDFQAQVNHYMYQYDLTERQAEVAALKWVFGLNNSA